MGRVPVHVSVADPATGNALAGVSALVKNRVTGASASLFSAETAGSVVSNPLTTDAAGRAFAWTENAPLQIDYTGTGLTAFSEYRDAQRDFVSVLPAGYDTQEVFYQSAGMAAAGVVWHLRYRSGASGLYKWEFLGGAALYAEVTTQQSTTSATYTDLATSGPSIDLPLAGDYDVTIGCRSFSNTNNVSVVMSYAIGGTAASDADILDNYSSYFTSPAVASWACNASRTRRKTGLGAVTLTTKYKVSGGTGYFGPRFISAIPVRVG